MLTSAEIQLVAAITRLGQLAPAARELQLDHSTIFRQLKSVEQKLGTPLFDRVAGRYIPTMAGNEVTKFAAQWSGEMAALARRVSNHDNLAEQLRITTTEDVAIALLPKAILALNKLFPSLKTESVIDNRLLDLSRLEADIAIRPTRKPPDGLVGKDLGAIATAVYGLRANSQPQHAKKMQTRRWITRVDTSGPTADRQWMETNVAPHEIIATYSNFSSFLAAAEAGIGLALLPCFVADKNPVLMRYSPPIKTLTSRLWLLYHARMRRDLRVQAFAKAAQAQLMP
jgi:DNA-binding transcriptional LysR family regulator